MQPISRRTGRRRCVRKVRWEAECEAVPPFRQEKLLPARIRLAATLPGRELPGRVRRGQNPASNRIPRVRIPTRKLFSLRNIPVPAGFQKIWRRWFWTTRRLA